MKWYRKAAEQGGNADGQFNLGACGHDGTDVGKDEAEAVKWFRKAADQCIPEAKERPEELCKNGP